MVEKQQPDESSSELDRILLEYFRRIDAGEEIDKDEFLAQHPEHAEELADFLSAEQQLDPGSDSVDPQDTPTLLTGRAASGAGKTLPCRYPQIQSDFELKFRASSAPRTNIASFSQPRQIVIQPGSPSLLRPINPPSLATSR